MTAQNCSGVALPAKEPAARHAPVLNFFARAGIVAGIALLCGCASYSPQVADPFHELKELEQRSIQLQGPNAPSPGKGEWLPLQARVDLTDGLDLAEANTLALFYSPDIRAAKSAQRISGAQLLGAGLLSNPELFLGPRISTGGSGLIFPAGISWELPLWGKREAEKELASGTLTVARARVAASELEVLTRVRSAYIRIAALVKTAAALEAQLAGSERVLQWASVLKQAGEIDGITAYLARLEHDDAQAALKALRLKLQSAKRRLQATLGLLPDAEMAIKLDPRPDAMPGLPQLNRRRMLLHPRIETAHMEYQAAEAALKLEIALQYPAIRLGPEFESEKGESSIGAGVGIELPLFDNNGGGIAEARARRETARENLAAALLELSHAEAQARAEAESNELILRDYRSGALQNAEQARKSLDLRLQAGQSNVLEVLAGLNSLTRARIREIELEEEAATARFSAAVAGGAVLNDPANNDSEKEKK